MIWLMLFGQWGSPERVTFDDSVSYYPYISGRDSMIFISFTDSRLGTGRVFFTYSLDNGASFSPEQVIAPPVDGRARAPHIVVHGDTLTIAYEDARTPDKDFILYSYDNGLTWTSQDTVSVDAGDCDLATAEPVLWMGNQLLFTYYVAYNRVRFRRSSDGGLSWEPAQTAHSSTRPGSVGLLRIGDVVYLFFFSDSASSGMDVYMLRSNDTGRTWAGPVRVSNTGNAYVPMSIIGKQDTLFAFWFTRHWGLLYESHSFDQGLSWSTPSLVSDSPAHGYFSRTAFDSTGNLWVVWCDSSAGSADILARSWNPAYGWSSIELAVGGASNSRHPDIWCDKWGNLHLVWADDRDGNWEIYHTTRDQLPAGETSPRVTLNDPICVPVAQGVMFITRRHLLRLHIYSVDGRLARSCVLSCERTLIPLDKGVYLWQAGERSGKFVVR